MGAIGEVVMTLGEVNDIVRGGQEVTDTVDEIMKNLPDEVGHTNAEIAQYRDKMLIDILKLHHKF